MPNLVTVVMCGIALLLLQTLPESLPGGAAPLCGGKGKKQHAPAAPVPAPAEGETDSLMGGDDDDDVSSEPLVDSSGSGGSRTPPLSVAACRFCTDPKPRLSIMFYTVAMFVEFFDPMLLSLW